MFRRLTLTLTDHFHMLDGLHCHLMVSPLGYVSGQCSHVKPSSVIIIVSEFLRSTPREI